MSQKTQKTISCLLIVCLCFLVAAPKCSAEEEKGLFPFTGREFITEISSRIAYMKSTDTDGTFDISVPTVNEFQLESTNSEYWEYNNSGGALDYRMVFTTQGINDIDSSVTHIVISTEYDSTDDYAFLNTLLLFSCIVPAVDHTLEDDEPYQIIADLITYETGVSEDGKLNLPVVTKNGIEYVFLVTNDLVLMCSIDEETYVPRENNSQNSVSNSQNIICYDANIYKVGADLAAGEYYLIPTSTQISAYYAVCSDGNGNDILENDNFDGPAYVTVENGQYFEVNGAKFALATDISTSYDSSDLRDGMYLVGKDIPAGEYALEACSDAGAYVCIYDNSSAYRNIIANANFDGRKYVTVNEGEYIQLKRCTGKLL